MLKYALKYFKYVVEYVLMLDGYVKKVLHCKIM